MSATLMETVGAERLTVMGAVKPWTTVARQKSDNMGIDLSRGRQSHVSRRARGQHKGLRSGHHFTTLDEPGRKLLAAN